MMENLVWKAYYHSMSGHEIRPFNIFEHGRFREEVRKLLLKCTEKEAFAEELRRSLFYYYCSTLRRNTMFSRMAGYQAFQTGIKATAIFLLGEKQTVSNGIKQDGSMAWMQHRPQMRIRPLFADTGILRMAIANTNTRGPSLEKMRSSLPIMVPGLLP